MHVAIDGVGNWSGGGWSVLRRAVEHLADDDRIEQLTVFVSPLEELSGPIPSADSVTWVPRTREHESRRARLGWYALGLALETTRRGVDVVVCMNGLGRTKTPRINVVQQAFAVSGRLRSVKPKSFALRQAAIRRETVASCRSADAVVVQTDWMRGEAADALGRDDVLVLPLGLPRPEPARNVTRRAKVLCVTNSLPYKRTSTAVEAVRSLQDEFPNLSLRLTLDGGSADAAVDARSADPCEMPALFRSSALLLAPSMIESFGLPVVEAFAFGCPVVAADRPWARSVADNAALYFEPENPKSAAIQVAEVLRSEEIARDLSRRGSARLRLLWEREPYRGLVDLIEEVA